MAEEPWCRSELGERNGEATELFRGVPDGVSAGVLYPDVVGVPAPKITYDVSQILLKRQKAELSLIITKLARR